MALLAACGSSGSTAADTTTTTKAPTFTEADRRISESFQLVADDLPGFQEIAPGTSKSWTWRGRRHR